jgi:Icc-related predicted phosphoesterase
MKIGFFSDVHGNIHSFKSGIKIFENLGVKKFIFLGDVCGYYYNSIEIIEMLIKFDNLICILGNHDEIFKSMYLKPNFEVINEYSLKYGSSLITNEPLCVQPLFKSSLFKNGKWASSRRPFKSSVPIITL